MRFFRKRKQPDAVVADPLMSLVTAVVEQYGYEPEVVGPDEVALVRPGLEEPSRLYLTNLRQWTAREPQDQWPAIVADFVGGLMTNFEVESTDPLDLENFALMRGLLRVRLYPEDFGTPTEMASRQIARGLVETLAIDSPTTLMLVRADIAEAWPVSMAELFEIAYENVRADGPLEVQDEVIDGCRVITLVGETAYVTAHALWVGDYPADGPDGSLVAVPAQGVVLAVPIGGYDLTDAVGVLARLAWIGYKEGPRSVSPHLYLWQSGQLGLAATLEVSDDSLQVKLESDLKSLLERLARD